MRLRYIWSFWGKDVGRAIDLCRALGGTLADFSNMIPSSSLQPWTSHGPFFPGVCNSTSLR